VKIKTNNESKGLVKQVNFSEQETKKEKKVALVAVGDVMLGRSVGVVLARKDDQTYPFRKLKEKLVAADIFLINLESPIFDPCPLTNGGMRFCTDQKAIGGLIFAGVDVANLANNHIYNYGQKGYQMTVDKLKESGIDFIDADNLAVIEKDGVTFGFLGFDLVSNQYPDEFMAERILMAKKEATILIVSVHWGAEYGKKESDKQQHWGRWMVDSGADLVIGHHPHVVLPIEIYQGVPIIYSLGNFIFDQMWSQETREGVLGKFVFSDGNLVDYSFVPIFINDSYQAVEIVDKEWKARILKRLEQ